MRTDKKEFSAQFKYLVIFIFLSSLIFSTCFTLFETGDSQHFKKYTAAAKLILEGKLSKERISDFSPLYLFVNLILERSGINPVPFLRIIQVLLIFFSGIFLFRLMKIYFSDYMALFGVVLFFLGKEILIYEKVIEPEPFMIFFITGFAYFFSIFSEGNSKGSKSLFIASFLLSLTLFTRPNLFLMIFAVPFFILFESKNESRDIVKIKLRKISIFLLMPFLSFLLILAGNYLIHGYILPYYQNPGYIIFEGNNPNSMGKSAIYPPTVDDLASEYRNIPDVHHEIYRKFARKITGKNLNIKEINDFWTKKALNFIKDHPLLYIKKVLLKFRLFFHNYARHDVTTAYQFDKYLSAKYPFLFPFWIVSVFALLGMILNLNNLRKYFHMYALLFFQATILFTGYVSSRQRVAVYPILIFFAISSVGRINEKKRFLVLFITFIIAGFLFFRSNFDILEDEDFLWEKYRISNELWVKSRIERDNFKISDSLKHASLSLIQTPWMVMERVPAKIPVDIVFLSKKACENLEKIDLKSSPVLFNSAILLINAKRYIEADKILANLSDSGFRFKRDFDHSSQPDFYRGVIAEKKKDMKRAIKFYLKALERSPGSPFSLSKLYVLTGEISYYELLVRYFDKIDAEFFTGRDLFNAERYNEALEKFKFVFEKIPEYRKNLIYLTATLGRLGKLIAAYNIGMKVISINPDPFPFKNEFKKIFEKRVIVQNKNPVAYYYYGYVLELAGRFREALQTYETALQLKPGDKLIEKRKTIVSGYISD